MRDQLIPWLSRALTRRPGIALAWVLLFAAAIAVGLAGSDSFAPIGWVVATLLLVATSFVAASGFAAFMVGEAGRLAGAERVELTTQVAELTPQVAESSVELAEHRRLIARVDQRAEGLAADILDRARATEGRSESLEREFERLEEQLGRYAANSVSLDVVSVLRRLGPLWSSEAAESPGTSPEGLEHGHAMLMGALVQRELAAHGSLRGKTLIEVGTTRERDPWQGSTEKLAVFAALTGMPFISVDADPENTLRAKEILKYLNPDAEAITENGEDYLAAFEGPLSYIYLDAFDFHHHRHSEYRKDRYRALLKTEITDEACWRMHELCAESISTKMELGGIVVIDDTWTDDAGQLAGKGKLAVPLLKSNGFEVIETAPRTIALQRREV